MKDWARRHRRTLGVLGAVLAAGMAVLWAFVVPERADEATGLRELAIRAGHPVAWALLAVFGVLVAAGASERARSLVAWAALAAYVAFVAALVL
ncbi:hypothetical protein SAMN04488242_0876 [Tessaracoccus oleiagri]|uniref:Uncharacterized protein n=1 Tax=Tessaracoccus oleiagri TaxID=686624 RepID=A0A1G9IEH4_9ACTN|nr:hypothetical protein SAMN04488242_0876 [Tessaracoccus oleiagri]